ncbi:hypothetical protein AM593_03917, partial [Mytilus galloprovincialis]
MDYFRAREISIILVREMFTVPSTIDITGFLKLFQQDGNPAATKLSPVRKRHPSRSFRLQNSSDIQKSSWPDCHYMPHFDIYLYKI